MSGLYIITGTLDWSGQSQSILSHFTIWVPPTTLPTGNEPVAPPVEKNAVPQSGDTLTSSDGDTLFNWQAGSFSDAVVIQIAPSTPNAVTGVPTDSTVVDVTAFMRSNHAPVTALGQVADIQFPHASAGLDADDVTGRQVVACDHRSCRRSTFPTDRPTAGSATPTAPSTCSRAT